MHRVNKYTFSFVKSQHLSTVTTMLLQKKLINTIWFWESNKKCCYCESGNWMNTLHRLFMHSASSHNCVMNVQVKVAHVVLVLSDEVKKQLGPFPSGIRHHSSWCQWRTADIKSWRQVPLGMGKWHSGARWDLKAFTHHRFAAVDNLGGGGLWHLGQMFCQLSKLLWWNVLS